MRRLCTFFLLFVTALSAFAEPQTINIAPIGRWLASQKDLRSLTADFVQTRALKTLRDPLTSPGRLWFRSPDAFRWETGNPAKSIFLKNGEMVLLIEPLKKKAVRFDVKNATQNREMQGMMMKFPLANSLEEFKRQFDVLDLQMFDDHCDVSLLPKDQATRNFLKSLNLQFELSRGELRYFEMITKEGSRLRNDFFNVQPNRPIDPAVFSYDLTGYEVSNGQK